MHISTANRLDLETRCKELCNKCIKTIKSYKGNDPKPQEDAAILYYEIIEIENELETAIHNSKFFLTRWKYKRCLKNVELHEATIYVIAEF